MTQEEQDFTEFLNKKYNRTDMKATITTVAQSGTKCSVVFYSDSTKAIVKTEDQLLGQFQFIKEIGEDKLNNLWKK